MNMITDMEKIKELPIRTERYKAFKRIFKEYRPQMASRTLGIIKDKGYRRSDIASDLGITVSAFSRAIGERHFSFSPPGLAKLSIVILGESCHQTVWLGENKVSLLPTSLAVIAKHVKELGDKEFTQTISKYAKDLYTREVNLNTDSKLSTEEVLIRRMTEASDDLFVAKERLLGANEASTVKISLINLLEKESTTVTTTSIAYYAFVLDTSIDYFILQDYTLKTDVGYLNNGETVVIKDNDLLSFISYFLRLSDEGQSDILAKVFELLVDTSSQK